MDQRLKTETLSRPFSIEEISDGLVLETYTLPWRKHSKYSGVCLSDELVFKSPTPYFLRVHEQYMQGNPVTIDPCRKPNKSEDGKYFEEMVKNRPGLCSIMDCWETIPTMKDEEMAKTYCYFLMVNKLNYEKLSNFSELMIPETKFVFLTCPPRSFLGLVVGTRTFSPVIIQKRLRNGIPLSKMYDGRLERFSMRFEKYRSQISSTIQSILHSPIADDIDWSPDNFIYFPETKKLSYVDIEPTFLIHGDTNAHNRRGIETFFT